MPREIRQTSRFRCSSFRRPHKAEVSADGVRGLVESVDTQTSPEEGLGFQTLLYSGRQYQVLLNLSLMRFEPRDCSAELLFRAFLFRNIGQRYYREAPSIGPMHCAHTDHHGQSPAVFRGQEERFAAPHLLGFLVKRLGESKLFGSVIQLTGVPADDLAARESCHFLEDRVDKKNLIRSSAMTTPSFGVSRMGFMSCSDCSVLLCTKSLTWLIPRCCNHPH